MSTDEKRALDKRLDDVAKAICAKPVRTPEDLIERAAIVLHLWADEISDAGDSEGAQALAAPVRGVLNLAGLKFDEVGRLL